MNGGEQVVREGLSEEAAFSGNLNAEEEVAMEGLGEDVTRQKHCGVKLLRK